MNNNTYTLWDGWGEAPSQQYSNFNWKKLGVGILTGGIGVLYMNSKEKKAKIAAEKKQIEAETRLQKEIAAAELAELQKKTTAQVNKTAQQKAAEIAAEKTKTKKIIIIAGSSLVGVALLIATIKILRK